MYRKGLLSICLLSYNQEKYIEEAIYGLLHQDFENFELIISDDCSTDNTYDIIKSIISRHKGDNIYINRNDENLGIVKHVNKLMLNLVHGEYVMLCGGDDISLPNRAKDTVLSFSKSPQIMAVTGGAICINKSGEIIGKRNTEKDSTVSINNTDFLKSTTMFVGLFGLTIRRTVFDTFGPLQSTAQTEDSCLRLRSIILGKIFSSTNYYIKYRIHENNISRSSNIYNLKTDGIAHQYSTDIKNARRLGILCRKNYYLLNTKVLFYKIDRTFKEKVQYTNYLIFKYLYKILIEINSWICKKITPLFIQHS